MRRARPILLIAAVLSGLWGAAQENTAPQAPEKFSGIYALSRGNRIYIQPWPGDGGKLAYADEAGEFRALFRQSEYEFAAGPGLLLSTPTELTVTFLPNSSGKVTRLIRRQDGVPVRAGRKLESYKREEVSFRNGEIRLAGTLHLPPGKGPHPALVLIHGTGATDRNSVLPAVHFLLSHGMALLAYDKRGVGASTGQWQTASLAELAGDALAAVGFLKGRNDIDPKRIGVFGASQGGWIGPLAASQSRDIAFLISISGPGESPAEVERSRLERTLRAQNFPESSIRDALALLSLRDGVTRGARPWEDFQAAVEKVKDAAWLPLASLPRSPDSPLFEHWRRLPLDYNPRPVLETLRAPVLALFGALDQNVLPARNADLWRAALERGGTKDYTVRVLPHANHMLLEAQTGTEDEFPRLRRFVPEYAPLALDWLRRRAIVSPSRAREQAVRPPIGTPP